MTKSLLSVVLILLGTGYPRPDANHAAAATAVVAGDRWYIVDAGRGTTLRVAGAELRYDQMRAVFLTHLHSDHIGGLPDLFQTSWQFGRKEKPFELYGPAGTKRLAGAMLEFFHDDIHIRRDIQEKLPAGGATIETHIVGEGVVLDDGVCRVTAFAEDHRPVEPAFGYRFDCGGKSIVVSGDTRPNANLIRHAKGADVLVMEAYLPEHFLKVDTPEVAKKLMAYHTSAEEAGDVATKAGVKTLVLTHLIPANAEGTFAERASAHFRGKVIVGRDLLRVEP